MTSIGASSERNIEHYDLKWRGLNIRVVYERDFLGNVLHATAHLQIQSEPRTQPLPMTETGYKSHFLPAEEIDASGGVIAYVTRWLDAAALRPAWKAFEREQRQGCLFQSLSILPASGNARKRS